MRLVVMRRGVINLSQTVREKETQTRKMPFPGDSRTRLLIAAGDSHPNGGEAGMRIRGL